MIAGGCAVNTASGFIKVSPEAAPTLRGDVVDLVTKLEGLEYRVGRIETQLFGDQPVEGSTGCAEKDAGDVIRDDIWRALRSVDRLIGVVDAMEARLGR